MRIEPLNVIRHSDELEPDDKRVIARFFDFGNVRRFRAILKRIMKLNETRVVELLAEVMKDFSSRHRNLEAEFLESYAEVCDYLPVGTVVSESRRLLIGAYFMMEYSIESAALFNPSIVLHPDQGGVPEGAARFLMSLRATGEGHVSSIVFRQGLLHASGELHLDPTTPFAYAPAPVPDREFERGWFLSKIDDLDIPHELVLAMLEALPEQFTLSQLQRTIDEFMKSPVHPKAFESAAEDMLWLARASYEVRFPGECAPSETVIFPATENESRGMEDLRLVRFVDDDQTVHYYGTYTAYNGWRLLPMLLDTCDFKTLRVTPLSGRYARNKGMALFPRRVNGQYLCVSRHDGESLFLLRSDEIGFWNDSKSLYKPTASWELIQVGNCGSPLETEAGWILLTHGVGPVREYCIGALLLDRDEPGRILGRLREPLIVPTESEREGYVPNVVYSCGAMVHNGLLVIPYAMSDSRTTFAEVSVNDLIQLLRSSGP
ncbi:MAG: glycoside hydrolase family 130 protein [Phycisphaerae bacterium]|nr:glycoside hydrolase family 130 protein [Phycisphaerae bacterium]